jgi:hypothetical protein
MKSLRIKLIVFLLILFVINLNTASGWYDETHLAVAKAAGYSKWYNATGADITKTKAGSIEFYNHYFDNNSDVEVTPEMVMSQISKYNNPADKGGHLYGAIIASLREYKKTTQAGKYPEYHIAFCAHYVGDLSQPLHNIPYDDFNKTHHDINDGIVEAEVLKNVFRIEKNMYPINLRPNFFEEDLSREIARIANLSRKLGHKLKTENRNMTKKEAYVQLGHSASLLRAILRYLGKIN